VEDKLVVLKHIIQLINQAVQELDNKQYTMLLSTLIRLTTLTKHYILPQLNERYIEQRIKQLVHQYLNNNISEEELKQKIIQYIKWILEKTLEKLP